MSRQYMVIYISSFFYFASELKMSPRKCWIFMFFCYWQLDNEEVPDDDSDLDEYDSVFLPI